MITLMNTYTPGGKVFIEGYFLTPERLIELIDCHMKMYDADPYGWIK